MTQDSKQAVSWWQLAAAQGNSSGQTNLGICFHTGKVVTQNFKQAVHWYQLATAQGDPYAQTNLGICFENGDGVKQDIKQAVHWYQLAAKQGFEEAQINLGICFEKGEGVTRDVEQAAHWYQIAAKQGHADAKFKLGRLLEDKNEEQALYWMLKFNMSSPSEKSGRDFQQHEIAQLQKTIRQLHRQVQHSLSAQARKTKVLEELSVWVHPIQHLVWGYLDILPNRTIVKSYQPPVAKACSKCVSGWMQFHPSTIPESEEICGTCMASVIHERI